MSIATIRTKAAHAAGFAVFFWTVMGLIKVVDIVIGLL